MKVIITGATGMVGKGVLLECLDHSKVSKVLCISRRSLGIDHPKLKEIIHPDFSEFESIRESLEDYDACYACMGVSSVGMKEPEFTQLTYSYIVELAKTLYALNPQMTFTYVSGAGTDSTEKGKVMWARVKGKTENDILNLGFKQAFMFRPGMIIPLRGIKPSNKVYRRWIKYLGWMLPLMKKLTPNQVVNTTQLGLAMIQITLKGYPKQIIAPCDMLELAKG